MRSEILTTRDAYGGQLSDIVPRSRFLGQGVLGKECAEQVQNVGKERKRRECAGEK